MFLALFIVVCALSFVGTAGDDNVTEYAFVHKGILTAECVRSYFRSYVSRRIPPRNYRYWHELLEQKRLLAEQGSLEGDVEPLFRIVGGSKVSITEAPYTVLYGLYCGGTIIAPDWVLTAAHCKEKPNFVLAGSTHRSLAKRYRICAHFTHPLWSAKKKVHSHDYDFQLVLLEQPIPITAHSVPIAIGTAEDMTPDTLVSVSGWGHLKYQDKMQDVLRRVVIPIVDPEVCRSLPSYDTISPRMLCIGYLDGNKDSCQGDSGGPAVANGKLIGLVSFGKGCADANRPGVYANVPSARDWIRFITALPL